MSVSVSNLSKIYAQQHAVDNVSFEISKGEILGFLGPNGAGKSTTMKILSCYLPQSSGTAKVCGFDTAEEPMEVRKKIGYLPESNPLYFDMYVREYLEFIAGLYQLGSNSKNRIEEMIELTGLVPERKKKIGQLSKGYKQRVGLAQAMLHNPEVLILDEPTSGLDPNQLTEIRALIRDFGKEKTVILSTHIMQEVQALCDRVLIINNGKIVADDTTENLQKRDKGAFEIRLVFKDKVSASELEALPDVKSVSVDGENFNIIAGKDIREALFKFATDKGYTLLTLDQKQVNMEDVFQDMTKSKG
ncbi:MAG: gliding motility-associated ABC transporter ATP-binding subunit GldA [Chitinophagales bacterium]